MNALIVEDDEKQAEYLQIALEGIGFSSTVERDGESGERAILTGDYTIVLMDIRLPQKNGIQIVHAVKMSGNKTPIILLTAQDAINTRCAGLDAGADDYLPKPFSFDELKSRINAVLRRSQPQQAEPSELHFRDLVLDTRLHTLSRGGRPIALTPQEYNLLEFFLRHPFETLSRRQLITSIWHCGSISPNVVDVRVCSLRNKLNGPDDHPLLRTVKGFGYVLD